jgi:hypothetical protein
VYRKDKRLIPVCKSSEVANMLGISYMLVYTSRSSQLLPPSMSCRARSCAGHSARHGLRLCSYFSIVSVSEYVRSSSMYGRPCRCCAGFPRRRFSAELRKPAITLGGICLFIFLHPRVEIVLSPQHAQLHSKLPPLFLHITAPTATTATTPPTAR